MEPCHAKFRWVDFAQRCWRSSRSKHNIINVNVGFEWHASRLEAAEIGFVKRAERNLPVMRICLLREALHALNLRQIHCLSATVRHMTDLSLILSFKKSSKAQIFRLIAGLFKEKLKIFLRKAWTDSIIELAGLLIGLIWGRGKVAGLKWCLLNCSGRTDLVRLIWLLRGVFLRLILIQLHHQFLFYLLITFLNYGSSNLWRSIPLPS